MLQNIDIESIVRKIVDEMNISKDKCNIVKEVDICDDKTDGFATDISTIELKEVLGILDPVNKEAYMDMKKTTPARIGIGRCGPRQNTFSLLRFRADHAAAMDAVFNDVSESFLKDNNLFSITTMSANKEQFLSNPETGKVIDEQNKKIILNRCIKNPQVQIIIADGLSSTSIESNVSDILPSIIQGLNGYGFSIGTTFFIKYGRVGAMDYVTEILNPDVTVLLIGERPGLVTCESMSCYMTYKGFVGMQEAMRTVVSNIYKNGLAPSEAGAHIATIIKKMIETKSSGLDLKL